MKITITLCLVIAGLINIFPVVGVISADQLEKLYGLPFENNDLIILMRHRAVLFGLLGAFILFSVVRPQLQRLACVAGLVSMVSFIVFAYLSAPYGDALRKVVVADVIGSLALVIVLVALYRQQSRGH